MEVSVYGSLPVEFRERFSSPRYSRRIESFLAEHGVKVILAQWMHPSLPLVELARQMGLPYYCQTHGTDITAGLDDPAVARAYGGYSETKGVVAPSEFGRRQLLTLGIRADRAHVMRHAVRSPRKPVVRPPGAVRCLVVGRLEPMKNPLLIIDAFRLALVSCPGLHLDFLGDGPLRPSIEQALDAHGLRDRVTLHGYLHNNRVHRMMRRSHIFVHPSRAVGNRHDTCPVALAEAMAHGMAVVSTRHGGIPEEIADGESGLLTEENDTRATADRIVELARNAELRARLGEAAWLRAREMFSPAGVRRSWLKLMDPDE